MARERTHRSRPRRRRGRFGGLYKFFAAILVIVAVTAACMVFFRVNLVTVTGNSRYTAEEIVEASGIKTGDYLIPLPKSRIAAHIRVALPYVRSVSIGQVLPETVVITVAEHKAAAAVKDVGGAWWLISSSGKLLEEVSDPGKVMAVSGMTAQSPVLGDALTVEQAHSGRLEYVLSLLKALEERGILDDCTQLDCSAAGELLLSYLNFQVKLPSTGDFPYMLSMLDAAFNSGRVERSGSGAFDFTISDGKVYYSHS